MRRQLYALAICASTLVLMAARCGSDADDGISIGAYPKVEGEEFGAGAAAPPEDGELNDAASAGDPKSDAGASDSTGRAPALPSDEPKEAADDLFADPLDGPSAGGVGEPRTDGATIYDDQSTFEPGGSGLPNAAGPDGESLPQVPGPNSDGSDLGVGIDPDLTE